MRNTPEPLMILVLGVGQVVAFGSSFYLMGVLGDPIARDLHLSPNVLFSLMSLSLLVSAVTGPRVGRFIDALGGRRMLMISSLVFAASLVLMAFSRNLVGLTVAMLGMGLGMSLGLYETAFAVLVRRYEDGARRPITGVALLGGLGSSIGWPVTLSMQQFYGWRGACLGWTLLHLLVCLPLVAVLIPREPARAIVAGAGVTKPRIAWDSRMVRLAVLYAGAWFVSTCMSAHLPRLLQAVGMTPTAAVGAAALVGVAAVSMRFAEFVVLRKIPALASTRIATLMHPLGALALTLIGPKAGALLALGQGAGNGMLTVSKGVLPLQVFGSADYGYRSSLLSTPARFAQAAGPLLFGLVLDRSAGAALALSSGVCLLMFAMTLGFGRKTELRSA